MNPKVRTLALRLFWCLRITLHNLPKPTSFRTRKPRRWLDAYTRPSFQCSEPLESSFRIEGEPPRMKSFQIMCQAYGIQKLSTTPYHPQGNGPVERFHQTMTHMIGKLDPEEKADWPMYLPALIQAYNGTRSAVTGYSPHY